jgi:hypothetical protein
VLPVGAVWFCSLVLVLSKCWVLLNKPQSFRILKNSDSFFWPSDVISLQLCTPRVVGV